MGKRIGLGMNRFELEQNKQLSEFVVQNLNKNPQFPFPDNSFDVVTCVVSIDYLTKPLEIFKEVGRVLRPGGRFIVSQSNRCFPTKAIQIWLNTNVRNSTLHTRTLALSDAGTGGARIWSTSSSSGPTSTTPGASNRLRPSTSVRAGERFSGQTLCTSSRAKKPEPTCTGALVFAG